MKYFLDNQSEGFMKQEITFLFFALTSILLYPQETKNDTLLYQLKLKGDLSEHDSQFFSQLDGKYLTDPSGTRYFIKRFVPDKSVDYKILEVVADSTIDYKIMESNPDKFYKLKKEDKDLIKLLKKYYLEKKNK